MGAEIAGHAVIRTKPDSRIRQKCMLGIPSTRPRHVNAVALSCTDLESAVEITVYATTQPRSER